MTRTNTLCEMHKQVNRKVNQFIKNVSNVGEESITDYLTWKWSEIDKRVQSVKLKPYTRKQEKSTGTDYDMEVWIIGKSRTIPFAVQAKKFVNPYGSYKSKLLYPDNTGQQLTSLMNHAKKHNRQPVYAIYTRPEDTSTCAVKCSNIADYGVFLMNASEAVNFTHTSAKSRLSRDDMLEKSIPFHALFCCSPKKILDYLFRASKNSDKYSSETNSSLPDYVQYLQQVKRRGDTIDKETMQMYIRKYELDKYKRIVVIDLVSDE